MPAKKKKNSTKKKKTPAKKKKTSLSAEIKKRNKKMFDIPY